MRELLEGALIGMTLGFGIGPGLILQFNACISRGFAAGFAVVFGIYTGDLILISVIYCGFSSLLHHVIRFRVGAMVCGALLMIFGAYLLLRNNVTAARLQGQLDAKCRKTLVGYFVSGLSVNLLNPSTYVFWVGMIGFYGITFGAGICHGLLFICGLLGTAIALDLVKCCIFSEIGNRLAPRTFGLLNRIAGSALLLAGLAVMVHFPRLARPY